MSSGDWYTERVTKCGSDAGLDGMRIALGKDSMGSLEMLVCEECLAKNTLDGRFCRQCGTELPEDLREEMKAEAEKLLIDGRQLLNDGRTDEARLVADAVLEIDPGCANALALKGDVFEKEGLFAEALEAYQRVAEVRPDHAMDRIRIAHIEKLVAAEEIAVEEPVGNRKGVLLVAAAGVLLLSVSAVLFMVSSQPKTDTSGWVVSNEQATGFTEIDPTLVPTVPGAVSSPEPSAQPTTESTTAITHDSPARRGGFVQTRPDSGFVRAGSPSELGNAPFTPPVNLEPWQNPQPNTNTATARPADEVEGATLGAPEQPTEKEDDPGVIEIRTKPQEQGNNPGASSGGAQTAEELIQKARNLYIQENYSGAAAAYEQAIDKGATSGATYQRLAQCYEKLGRRGDAIKNYRKAVAAFDRQISRGSDSSSIRAAKESCERAISALGG